MRRLLNLPITLANLGSPAAEDLDFHRESLWKRMSPAMGHRATAIPVYLVNPGQMDFLYPPERLRQLDPRSPGAREWLERSRMQEEEFFFPWERLEREMDEGHRHAVAMGLYVSRLKEHHLDEVLDRAAAAPDPPPTREGPAIYLCPERILNRAAREGVSPGLVLDKVYYHELGHALMDTGPTPYDQPWGRLVEESLANGIAYRRFRGREALHVQRLIRHQPLEYQGYVALEDWDLAWELLAQLEPLPWIRDEAWDWWWYGVRRGFVPPIRPLPAGDPFPSWVRAWREAKREGVDRGLWSRLAGGILLHLLELP